MQIGNLIKSAYSNTPIKNEKLKIRKQNRLDKGRLCSLDYFVNDSIATVRFFVRVRRLHKSGWVVEEENSNISTVQGR